MTDDRLHYRAFVSYRHVSLDRKWAKWLIRRLEGFRVPKDLVEKGYPRRLGRIFRDEDEFSAAPDLHKHIKNALDQSEFLIVICSRNTPESTWIGQEIEYFRSLGRSDNILTLLIDGEPDESFPPALMHLSGGQGIEPIAADIRPSLMWHKGSARQKALCRIVAGILSCSFDQLWKREGRRIRRNRWLAAGLTSVSVLLFAGLATFGYQSQLNRKEALINDAMTLINVAENEDGYREALRVAQEKYEELYPEKQFETTRLGEKIYELALQEPRRHVLPGAYWAYQEDPEPTRNFGYLLTKDSVSFRATTSDYVINYDVVYAFKVPSFERCALLVPSSREKIEPSFNYDRPNIITSRYNYSHTKAEIDPEYILGIVTGNECWLSGDPHVVDELPTDNSPSRQTFDTLLLASETALQKYYTEHSRDLSPYGDLDEYVNKQWNFMFDRETQTLVAYPDNYTGDNEYCLFLNAGLCPTLFITKMNKETIVVDGHAVTEIHQRIRYSKRNDEFVIRLRNGLMDQLIAIDSTTGESRAIYECSKGSHLNFEYYEEKDYLYFGCEWSVTIVQLSNGKIVRQKSLLNYETINSHRPQVLGIDGVGERLFLKLGDGVMYNTHYSLRALGPEIKIQELDGSPELISIMNGLFLGVNENGSRDHLYSFVPQETDILLDDVFIRALRQKFGNGSGVRYGKRGIVEILDFWNAFISDIEVLSDGFTYNAIESFYSKEVDPNWPQKIDSVEAVQSYFEIEHAVPNCAVYLNGRNLFFSNNRNDLSQPTLDVLFSDISKAALEPGCRYLLVSESGRSSLVRLSDKKKLLTYWTGSDFPFFGENEVIFKLDKEAKPGQVVVANVPLPIEGSEYEIVDLIKSKRPIRALLVVK